MIWFGVAEVVRYQPDSVYTVEGEIEMQSEPATKGAKLPSEVMAMLAEPECGFTVSRAIVSAPGLFNAAQLQGTEPHACSKPGFGTKFGPAPADATPNTSTAPTVRPTSIMRTAAIARLPSLALVPNIPKSGRKRQSL